MVRIERTAFAFITLATIVAGLIAPRPAFSAPKGVRLSFAGGDSSTSITVAWNTATNTQSIVEYGTSQALGARAIGTSFATQSALGQIHQVQVDGLSPDTVYFYRAGAEQDWSPTYQFRTAPRDDPSCGSFNFVAVGDGRADLAGQGPADGWGEIATEAQMNANPAFFIHSGDIVKSGVEATEWDDWLGVSEVVTPYVPMMPAVGNHDVLGNGLGNNVDPTLYLSVFALPINDVTRQEDAYFFTYANAIFVSISTNTFTGGASPFADQAAWLDRVLTDHPRTWKFVYFHYPTFTSADNVVILGDFFPANEVDQNPALIPVFERHQVDFVIMGHHHMYERFEPLLRSADWTVGMPDPAGVNYLITGGAGAPGYTDFVVGVVCGSSKDPGSVACSSKFHYVSFAITDNRLHLETWSTRRQARSNDASNRELVDQYDVVKNPAPSGCGPNIADAGPSDSGSRPDAAGGQDGEPGEDASNFDASLEPDTGLMPQDAGLPTGDGGVAPVEMESCGCSDTGSGPGRSWLLLLAFAFLLRAPRWRRSW